MRPDQKPSRGRHRPAASRGKLAQWRWAGWALALVLVGGVGLALKLYLSRPDREAGFAKSGQGDAPAARPTKSIPSPATLPQPGARRPSASNRVESALGAGPAGLTSNSAVQGGLTNAPVSDEEKVNALVNEGTRLLGEGNAARAGELYGEALKLNPEDETVHFNLGVAWGQLGQAEAAKKEYLEALRLYPEYPEAHVNLGNLLAKQGQNAEAMEQFNLALKANPDNANAHNALGTALAAEKNYKEAMVHFLEAIRLQPNHLEARCNLGMGYLAQGKTEQAIEQFTEILKQHPDFPPAQAGLQRALRKKSEAAGGRGTVR